MANIRIKCSCGSRLKAPRSAAGGHIRCWHCGNRLTVPGQSGLSGDLEPEDLSFSFDAATPWIRMTCECGKTIKCPPDWVGKNGTCPRCARMLILVADPKSPASLRTGDAYTTGLSPDDIFADMDALNDQDGDERMKSSATLDAISVPSEPVGAAPPHAKPAPVAPVAFAPVAIGKDHFLRVTCTCGKVVKAPLEWAGTTGNCPRCGKKILMPKVAEELLAEARKSPAPGPPLQSSKPFNPEDSAVMDSILSTDEVATLTATGVTGEDWEKKKQDRLQEWNKRKSV